LICIDKARSGNTNANGLCTIGQLTDQGNHGVNNVIAVCLGGRNACFSHNAARLIDQSAGNLGATNINADCVHG
jgi:hypothetical protein